MNNNNKETEGGRNPVVVDEMKARMRFKLD